MTTHDESWTCRCGFSDTGSFCSNCGRRQGEDDFPTPKHDDQQRHATKKPGFELVAELEKGALSVATSAASQMGRTAAKELTSDLIKHLRSS